MRVDPNQPVDLVQECVLCESGTLTLHDGSASSKGEIAATEGHFLRFCRTLDPNKTFIAAIVPDVADRDVFFAARDAAEPLGLHVQATMDTAERHRAHWQAYLAARRARAAEPDSDGQQGDGPSGTPTTETGRAPDGGSAAPGAHGGEAGGGQPPHAGG